MVAVRVEHFFDSVDVDDARWRWLLHAFLGVKQAME
jgi:hypothetical protein